ncbi:MAG: potassium transporter TrkA [Planctomycetes bacterium]|jgi:K+/H+ antiporter YhaU regulatory subunit KhtT|nr:TrkA C-terminal domain-containing protein [Phycisphaerae bacterium]NBB96146.1 potassium transporter TrkA [Planctomycetota bacterium]
MIGIIGIVTSLTVLFLSLLITRLATMALTLTGLSRQVARFQARSAFTGTGFTTAESEDIVAHPIRRQIIMWLMIVRSAGVITIIISVILSFIGPAEDVTKLIRLAWLVGGIIVLWLLTISQTVTRLIEAAMAHLLKRYTDLDVRDYLGLLKLAGEYAVNEVHVEEDDWLAEKTLAECDLPEEGVTVLGINREDGSYVGAPRGKTRIHAGDTLILYGQSVLLQELGQRRTGGAGDAAHRKATADEEQRLQQQDIQEAEHERKREAHQEVEQAEETHEAAAERLPTEDVTDESSEARK